MFIKKFIQSFAAVILVIGISGVAVAEAGQGSQSSATHSVTITVPQVLKFSGETSSINLAFPDSIAGSETNVQSVNYSVKTNNLLKQNGVIQAKLDSPFDSIDFKASPGGYVKTGGNASLVAANSGYVTVSTESVNLYNKQTDEGTGKIVEGNFPISYKALALSDLAPSNTSRNLVISITAN